MGLLGVLDGLLEWGLVYGHLWWVILSNLLEGLWGVALEIGMFSSSRQLLAVLVVVVVLECAVVLK